MAKKDLFRKSALDRMSSPDQLNDYIRLSNPSVWVVLAAVLLLLVAVFVWGYFGTLPTIVSANGVGGSGGVVCFLSQEEAASIKAGMTATVGAGAAAVTEVGVAPLSEAEAASELGSDYAVQEAGLSDWNIRVVLQPQEGVADGQVYPVKITAGETRPIDFILN